MDYRRRKQIMIVLIILVVLGLLGAGAYYRWFYQAPTCFDNKQNQGEAGVDCGGPCSVSCELLTVKKLETQWVKAVFLKDGFYDLAAKVANPNPNFGLAQFSYTFKLLDVAGQVIAQREGASFILPNQSKYIIEANVAAEKKPVKVEITIADSAKTDWQRLKDNFAAPDIYVHDKQFKYLEKQAGQPAVAQVAGIIKNNSNFDFDRIQVAVALFDVNRELVGVNKTEARTVLAGEDRYFSALWFSPLSSEVKSVDILPDTNLFSDSNFMRRPGETEKFQEY